MADDTTIKKISGLNINGVEYLFDNSATSEAILELEEITQQYQQLIDIAKGTLFGITVSGDSDTANEIEKQKANLLAKFESTLDILNTGTTSNVTTINNGYTYTIFSLRSKTKTEEDTTSTVFEYAPYTRGLILTDEDIESLNEGTEIITEYSDIGDNTYKVLKPYYDDINKDKATGVYLLESIDDDDYVEVTSITNDKSSFVITKDNNDITYNTLSYKEDSSNTGNYYMFCYSSTVTDEESYHSGILTEIFKKIYNVNFDTDYNDIIQNSINKNIDNLLDSEPGILIKAVVDDDGNIIGNEVSTKNFHTTGLKNHATFDITDSVSLYRYIMYRLDLYYILFSKYIISTIPDLQKTIEDIDATNWKDMCNLIDADKVSTASNIINFFGTTNTNGYLLYKLAEDLGDNLDTFVSCLSTLKNIEGVNTTAIENLASLVNAFANNESKTISTEITTSTTELEKFYSAINNVAVVNLAEQLTW